MTTPHRWPGVPLALASAVLFDALAASHAHGQSLQRCLGGDTIILWNTPLILRNSKKSTHLS